MLCRPYYHLRVTTDNRELPDVRMDISAGLWRTPMIFKAILRRKFTEEHGIDNNSEVLLKSNSRYNKQPYIENMQLLDVW